MRVPLTLACGAYDRPDPAGRGDVLPDDAAPRVRRRPVTAPSELTGGLVGVAEYQLTANVWSRGILAERHGLAVGAVRYRLYTPRVPHRFGEGRVRRLFLDVRAEEERYFAETGIFPVMHVVVLRRDVYDQRPRLAETAALASLLPWGYAEAEPTRQLMGTDFWTCGLEGNAGTLETFVRYSFEPGLIKRRPSPDELFAAETREEYVI